MKLWQPSMHIVYLNKFQIQHSDDFVLQILGIIIFKTFETLVSYYKGAQYWLDQKCFSYPLATGGWSRVLISEPIQELFGANKACKSWLAHPDPDYISIMIN